MAEIHYHAVPAGWTREEKLRYLAKAGTLSGVEWTELVPDARHNWLCEDEREEFVNFLPISIPPRQRVGIEPGPMIFQRYSLGVSTNRDDTVYAFSEDAAAAQVQRFAEDYNAELDRFKKKRGTKSMDGFVDYEKLKWSRNLKRHLRELDALEFDSASIRRCLARPFTERALYFADIAVDEPGHMREFFPHAKAEQENRMMAVTDVSYRSGWGALMTNHITDLHLCASTDAFQCFPFYTYDGVDGARRENIPLSTLTRFQQHYDDEKITKWDIFHYVYAVLHHPEYRTRYAANLRRELPRLPLLGKNAKAFRAFAATGRKLADLHVHYEQAAEHPLERIENPGEPLNWRVEKMRLGKDKARIVYNDFLTLAGIPEAAFAYRLGNRSALEWVIDQYQTSTDPRSGITNDPNREDEPDYIVKLIGRVITVSLETQKHIAALPPLMLA